MNTKNIIALTIGVISILSSLTSQAALVTKGDDAWGDESIVNDTLTGIDWLKPAKTINQSYIQIQNILGSGNYANFRYATYDEVVQLFIDSGLPMGWVNGYSSYWDSAVEFVTKFGPTYSQKWIAENWLGVSGLMLSSSNNEVNFANAKYGYWNWGTPLDTTTEFGVVDEQYCSILTGSWLIRENVSSVPIPSSILCFFIGIACFYLTKIQKMKNIYGFLKNVIVRQAV